MEEITDYLKLIEEVIFLLGSQFKGFHLKFLPVYFSFVKKPN